MAAQNYETVSWMGREVPVYPMETIDFSLVLSQDPEELERLYRCCESEGYFYLDLSGLDGRRMLEDKDKTLELMYRFFCSPLEAKNEFGLISPHLGYEPLGARTGVMLNSKAGYEMFKVSRDEIQKPTKMIPAIVKNHPDIKTLENAIGGLNIVGKTILAGLSTAMGLNGMDRFEKMHRNDRPSTSTLAMMHYEPSDPTKDINVGHQKHTDISSLTILFSEQWGLQVRPPTSVEWGFVKPKEGCAILNVGDSLRFASGHKLNACIHRVVPFDFTEHRYSIAYFLRAEDETRFIDSEGRNVTAGQWHDEKFDVFRANPLDQAKAPPSMLYGGMMPEDELLPAVMPPTVQHAPKTAVEPVSVEAH